MWLRGALNYAVHGSSGRDKSVTLHSWALGDINFKIKVRQVLVSFVMGLLRANETPAMLGLEAFLPYLHLYLYLPPSCIQWQHIK